jgi:hypothetical protein
MEHLDPHLAGQLAAQVDQGTRGQADLSGGAADDA